MRASNGNVVGIIGYCARSIIDDSPSRIPRRNVRLCRVVPLVL